MPSKKQETKETVTEIPLSEIRDFPDHPYMAKEIGVTEQTIYRWEQGLSKPHISSKGKLMSL